MLIVKELAVAEDISFGMGTVEQERLGETEEYEQVNASHIPYNETQSITEKLLAMTSGADASYASALLSEASRRTAASYAIQPQDELVQVCTSNGDGSYSYEEVADTYSALHYGAAVEDLTGIVFPNLGIGISENGSALYDITDGQFNVAVGHSSSQYLTSGEANTAVGFSALRGDQTLKLTGMQNVGIGMYAGINMTSGSSNTFVGNSAGFTVMAGNDNTFIGKSAGYNASMSSRCVYIGNEAGYNGIANDKLKIANNQIEALIEGDFSAKTLKLNINELNLLNLPTADPVVAGDVWNDSGTLKISAG